MTAVLSPQGDPLPASLVDLVRNSPISSVDDLKLLLQQETNAIGTNDHHAHAHTHTHTHTNNTDVEEVSVWVCLQRPEEIGMQQGRILEYMPSTMLRQYLPATAAGMMNQLDERERERERES